jgi:uncharacterized FlaG/YvyC family protein
MDTIGSKLDSIGGAAPPNISLPPKPRVTPPAEESAARETVPEEVDRAVARATEKLREKPQQSEMSYEDARQVAQDLENFLNSSRETVVKFEVSLIGEQSSGGNPFQFQVVDRETGEIVRQFPPGDLFGMAHDLDAQDDLAGLVVDKSA